MSRLRYEDDDKLMQDVRSCMQKLLSTDETIAELHSKGREISKKTLQRIKRRIKKIHKDKITNMTTNGKSLYVFGSMDILGCIKDELIKLGNETNDPWIKITAFMSAVKVILHLSKFFDSGQDLDESYKSR